MFTTQFHVKEQGAAKRVNRRRRRQDQSVLKKVLDIDRRFIDAISAYLCDLCVNIARDYSYAEITERNLNSAGTAFNAKP